MKCRLTLLIPILILYSCNINSVKENISRQEIPLKKGWNAVYSYVFPFEKDSAWKVFEENNSILHVESNVGIQKGVYNRGNAIHGLGRFKTYYAYLVYSEKEDTLHIAGKSIHKNILKIFRANSKMGQEKTGEPCESWQDMGRAIWCNHCWDINECYLLIIITDGVV